MFGLLSSCHLGSDESKLIFTSQPSALKIKDEASFIKRLGCEPGQLLKVVSIFGNTGEGKSHTLNHTFFAGREVFKTSPAQESCTVGVWAALDPVRKVVVVDTEGLLGNSSKQGQRTRLLLKVLAVSDLIVYRTHADRLHDDLFKFLGDASDAYLRHFTKELKATTARCGLDVPLSTLGPAVVIFHETVHTKLLGAGRQCRLLPVTQPLPQTPPARVSFGLLQSCWPPSEEASVEQAARNVSREDERWSEPSEPRVKHLQIIACLEYVSLQCVLAPPRAFETLTHTHSYSTAKLQTEHFVIKSLML